MPTPKQQEDKLIRSMNGVVREGQRMQIMTITPDLAQHWLAEGGKNRRLTKGRAERFADAMKRGEWRLTFEAIKLDANGQLRDGQHRLTGVVISRVPIEALVVFGVEENAFDVMDSGAARSVADNMSIHDEERSRELAATLRVLTLWHRQGQSFQKQFLGGVTTPEAQKTLLDYPEVRGWVPIALSLKRAGIKGGVGLWGALLTLFGRIDANDAMRFAERVQDGASLAPGHPVLTLRKQLFNNPISTRHQARTAVWIIKSWNAFRAGEKVYQLKWGTDEKFPEPE